MKRDLVKTATFAALHFSIGFGVAYLISGSLPVALGVALIEPAVNTVAFFFHERAWQHSEKADAAKNMAAPRIEDHHSFRNLRSLALAG
ncbi:DUF2061 domain-containing protein [Dongia rigui]|uniref:DUF2061 domain-containing protein n=1 Tax=Dongia rigui TaxID=940149 RepID=A0ABU5E2K3_9PROT|nr:DUF2061 domain-containing protein [Dongia rigui]MDY0873532.1 DUF2061 domain-containing protein [Dongia rigui]